MTGGNGGWRRSTYCANNSCLEVHWHKSSHSGTNGCVEVGVAKTSSHTNGSTCVEVEGLPDGWVAVRDSERPGEMVRVDPASWRAFVAGVKGGEFDYPEP